MSCSPPQLPESWSVPEAVQDTVVADGIELRRSGVSSRGPAGVEVTGAAAETHGDPLQRSYFELLERLSTIEAIGDARSSYELRDGSGSVVGSAPREAVFPESDRPERWRYARSNGIALHATWEFAARRAKLELVERDRLMRSWLGSVAPVRLALADDVARLLTGAESYRWECYEFPTTEAEAELDPRVVVVGVFGFPQTEDAPLVMGFAARDDRTSACDAAATELLQQLAFLWGEPIPTEPPPTGNTPLHHLEHYQYRANQIWVRGWLAGDHVRHRHATEVRAAADTHYVDLTPAWMSDFRVAKALCRTATPLVFGASPFTERLPFELSIHPFA